MPFEMGIENSYIVKGGAVKVTLARGEDIFARNVRGCCMAYSTAKAENVAGLVPEAGSNQGMRREGRMIMSEEKMIRKYLLSPSPQALISGRINHLARHRCRCS